jgi:hypothetical protein
MPHINSSVFWWTCTVRNKQRPSWKPHASVNSSRELLTTDSLVVLMHEEIAIGLADQSAFRVYRLIRKRYGKPFPV